MALVLTEVIVQRNTEVLVLSEAEVLVLSGAEVLVLSEAEAKFPIGITFTSQAKKQITLLTELRLSSSL